MMLASDSSVSRHRFEAFRRLTKANDLDTLVEKDVTELEHSQAPECLGSGHGSVSGTSHRRWRLSAFGLIGFVLVGCNVAGPIGNESVPQPTKLVELERYTGVWYELARYENGFERGCEGVTAEYTAKTNGDITIVNSCRQEKATGPLRTVQGNAKSVADSGGAKFKVSFFGPFYVGNYWILDHAPDYSWSIVGEPSGRFLWLLSRTKSKSALATMTRRAGMLGYDTSMLRITKH